MRVYPLLKELLPLVAVMQMAILCSAAGVAARDYSVALVPFRMNADENIVYIKNGVRDMITSRLSYNAPITLIEQSLVQDALATMSLPDLTKERLMELGSALQADYVIGGSISKMGNNVSIDISILNVMQGGTTSAVFTQSLGLDELIPHMMVLTREIADTIVREGEPAPSETVGEQPPAEAVTVFDDQIEGTEKVDEERPPGTSQLDGEVETDTPLSDDVGSEIEKKTLNPWKRIHRLQRICGSACSKEKARLIPLMKTLPIRSQSMILRALLTPRMGNLLTSERKYHTGRNTQSSCNTRLFYMAV